MTGNTSALKESDECYCTSFSQQSMLSLKRKNNELSFQRPRTFTTLTAHTFQQLPSDRPRQNASVQTLHSSISNVTTDNTTLDNLEHIFKEQIEEIMLKEQFQQVKSDNKPLFHQTKKKS